MAARTAVVALMQALMLAAAGVGQLAPYTGTFVLKDGQGDVVGTVIGLDNKVAHVAVAVGSDTVILDWDNYDGYFNSTRRDEQYGGGLGRVYFLGTGCTGNAVLWVEGLALTTGGLRAAVSGTQAGNPTGPEKLFTAPASTPYQDSISVLSFRDSTGLCTNASATVSGFLAQDVYDLAAEYPWPRAVLRAAPIYCDGFCSGSTQRWSETEP